VRGRRLLAALLLAGGLLAMHAFIGDHGPHAQAAMPLDPSMPAATWTAADRSLTATVPAAERSVRVDGGPTCRAGCGVDAGGVWLMCLAVATGAAVAVLLFLLPRRDTSRLAGRTGLLKPTPTRPAARPPRPPSLVFLCVART